MPRNPMAFDLPPGMREPKHSSTRPSVERALASSGVDMRTLLEFSKTHPEILASLRDQLAALIESGATQNQVEEFFRKQAEASQSIVDQVAGSDDWKSELLKIRDRLPKAN